MLTNSNTFSSFSVPDIAEAKRFYADTLGLTVKETPEGLQIPTGSGDVFVYHSTTNKPADFTILNFTVDDMSAAVDDLMQKGITMEHYDLPGIKTDDKGIAHGDGTNGPKAMAWFKDPAGNILGLMQEK